MARKRKCPYPASEKKCVKSSQGLCCKECVYQKVCVETCKNTPEKCGRDF